MTPITDCLKKGEFTLSSAASKTFIEIKKIIVSAPIMRLPDFFKIFEVVCDTSEMVETESSLKKIIQLFTSVRSWMIPGYDTPPFDKSSMRWFKRFAIDNIIYRHRQWRTYSGGE